jgi:hypothetical protein
MIGTAVVAVCVGALGIASTASAASHSPKGEFAAFGECPLNNPEVKSCIYSLSSSGSFKVGTKTVPLVNPVTLQGGIRETETGGEFVAAENGNTLSKTAQPVPGGLLGITAPAWWPKFLRDLFNEVVINQGATGVTATVELAQPASKVVIKPENLLAAEGTALSLPVKIKLSNAFLGSNCYVGSNSSPIVIDFTTGTTSPPPPNVPISGSPGSITVNGGFTLFTFSGGKLVNNSFAAPGASGCGGLFALFVDPLVNSILGTPAAAGNNTAILEGQILSGVAAAVKASE